MSEDLHSKPYHFPVLEDEDGASGCSSMAQLHRMGGFSQGGPDLGLPSEGSDSSGQDPPASPHSHRKSNHSLTLHEEDVEMKSSGSSGSGTESHGNESHGNESHGNESNGHESVGSSNGNSKDSALLESSESNKSSNSHSPSPPSSSNAFSLLSSEQDNPSTSGCSSQESAKAKTQKEVIKTLKELKLHLPAEKRHNNKSSTLNTLKYALRCVRQVEANEEYYQLLMINDSQPSGLDVSSYTIEEIDSITSEYTLKNNDIFAVAVSLNTGRIVYISDQAASILNCKRDVFKNTKFVEFLTPQDVSVFYSFTTPYRLPSWSMCTGAESSPSDCMQERSFFCRISGGKECKGDLQYYPFRMTPYLMKVQDTVHTEDQFCCLLLAERVHSGYDAPRIPTDKRIFTTTHTPNCVFQDVDERAVPLLGYLPQDLIGTPVLLHLHPNDRPIMLAIHRKILQYAGQPFEHSSIRFCVRNGEYIILDTSWSSFVNPWSRKVSFVIGRHKVRMGPVNEDIFVAPAPSVRDRKTMDSDIQEITEQIHKLLLQPVHTSGSSGYGSLSRTDHLLGLTSSSESLDKCSRNKMQLDEEELSSKARPRTFQEICKGIHLQKSQKQHTAKTDNKSTNGKSVQKSLAVVVSKDLAAPLSWKETGFPSLESRSSSQEHMAFNDQTVYSYQQISCLDSVVRYLESCNVPITMKRKCQSSSNTTSSNSDDGKPKGTNNMQGSEEPALLKDQSVLSTLDDQDKKSSDAATAVVGTSLPLPVPNKPESVVSITSQCSYSSTIVHVGDKKPHPESEIIEDMPVTGETVESVQNNGSSASTVSPPSLERESYKKLGLTKQVLAAHTQKEEQAFLYRFRELRRLTALKANCSQYLERQREQIDNNAGPAAQSCKHAGPAELTTRRGTRNKKTKSKRAKQVESSDSAVSRHRQQHLRPPLLNQGLNPTSWSRSDTSQSQTFPMAYSPIMPGYPVQVYPRVSPHTDTAGFGVNQGNQAPPCPATIHPAPYTTPMVTSVVALVLPNYVFPQVAPGPLPPPQPGYHPETSFSVQTQPFCQAGFPGQVPFTAPPSICVQNQLNSQNHFAPQAGNPTPQFCCPPSSETPKAHMEGQSRSSSPQSGGRESPPMFQSRCSSPLNLLELELSVDRQDSTVLSSGGQGNNASEREKVSSSQAKDRELQQPSLSLLGPPGPLYSEGTPCVCELLSWDKVCSRLRACSKKDSSRGDGNNSDVNSLSSDMLDIILHEDSCSGTGSATSGSMGSGSNGCGTSASGTSNSRTSKSRTSASGASASGTSGSGTGSNNSSNYFGSVDSSQNSQKVDSHLSSGDGRLMEIDQGDSFMKYVLQDPLWLVMANTDDEVMMTYQLPSRDIQKVLKEDREKLKLLQKSQPRFSEEQKKELNEVHPWIKKGEIPKAVNVKVCSCCDGSSEAAEAAEEAHRDLDIGDTDSGDADCQQRSRDEPLNTDIISCHDLSSGSHTQPA
ncbi:period circadian protein homolog 2 isoform X2 [Cheilinus undulatus]|uniref:period circadian protein homolog 2 isoform X2 n=1 Tax=Cheilinus undulatus TaxID=241271 RepID=UPI001BD4A996|nr:period circadian protein homolog 2 isoform X2 [Cheilinus undulatus]